MRGYIGGMENINIDGLIAAWITLNNGEQLRTSTLYDLAENLDLFESRFQGLPNISRKRVETWFGMKLRHHVGRSAHGFRLCMDKSGSHRYYYLRDETRIARDHLP